MKSFEFFGESFKYIEVGREDCSFILFVDFLVLGVLCSLGKFKLL